MLPTTYRHVKQYSHQIVPALVRLVGCRQPVASGLQPRHHVPVVRRRAGGDLRPLRPGRSHKPRAFPSSALKLPSLRATWTAVVLALLGPFLLVVNGRIVLLADGIKAPKT